MTHALTPVLSPTLAILVLAFVPAAQARGVSVIGDLVREHTVSPGQTVEASMDLRNDLEQPVTTRIYQTDYTFTAGGENRYPEPGTLARSNAPWIAVTPSLVRIAEGSSAHVEYRMTVPNDPGLAGTYWSLLMVEPQAAPTADVPAAAGEQPRARFVTVVRYAVIIITHVGDSGKAELRFTDKRIVTDERGGRVLRLTVENTGERSLRPAVWAELYDDSGTKIARLEGPRKYIFPQCSTTFDMDLSTVGPGPRKALVIADAGGEALFGAQYDLQIAE
ncbi:MAG: hypothetical protein HYV63_23290 [Candidatus Schekmanbacteria bacterium]|nr:hypothetical protein [Candidatus Schekmanbacteria bacterium]